MSDHHWRLSATTLGGSSNAIALEGVGQPVSYGQLQRRAHAIAAALSAAGIEPGDRIAVVSGQRAHDEPVALAGIALAQAVVVPLDASSPPRRLGPLVNRCGCRAVLHDGPASQRVLQFAEDRLRFELDDGGHIVTQRGDAPTVGPSRDPSIACILHTSGSTGEPKPVPIRWAGLDAFTAWMIQLTELTEYDRVLRIAELTFDLAWFDHLATFRAGATLCTMSRRKLATGRSLWTELRHLGPTVVYGVPALFAKLVAALPDGQNLDPRLRVICFAGEVYPPSQLRQLAKRAPEARIFNLFGPTETNVCTYHEVDRVALVDQSELPIGVPCPYAQCELLGDDGVAIQEAGTGELVVRGPTAVGGRCATGDQVERRKDGLFYFRGRLDRMVKILGYRLEPGEVEATLANHPQVREAAVVVETHPRLGKTLQAFVSLHPQDNAASSLKLRQHLAQQLPPHMVPAEISAVDDLPRTTNGKIDYQALKRAT